jgi:uncharacterized protein YggE
MRQLSVRESLAVCAGSLFMQSRMPPEGSARGAAHDTCATSIPGRRAESMPEQPPVSARSIFVFTIALVSAPVLSAQTPALAFDDRPKITVGGGAMLNAVADRIILSFGIEAADFDVAAAKRENDAMMRKAVAAIKGLRIVEKDIQTDHISIEPRFKGSSRMESFLGFWVRNTFVVTLNDAAKVADLIANVLATNGASLNDLDVDTARLGKDRAAALKAVREKAGKMAAALREEAGRPIEISDGSGGWWYFSSWSGRFGRGGGGGTSQNVVQDTGAGGGDVSDTIALGTIGIRASVSATFELKR